jgi:4-diphosphocytidyl-2-C-methyl-D-erythritol kinase
VTTTSLTVCASAKVNLDLRILARRSDGFHELRTIFQSLALHDRITIRGSRGAFRLECDAPGVPLDSTNLVWRAAEAAWHAAGRRGRVRGLAIRLEKRIPAAAGLGGGSSDAAATLVGVNRALRLGLGRAELLGAAAALGSDVPFFLVGGTALGLGRGEEVFPLPDVPALHVVLVRPPFGVSTADAYRWFAAPARGTRGQRGLSPGRGLSPSRGQTPTGGETPVRRIPVPWRPEGLVLVNDLEQAVLPRHPEIAGARRALLRRGALAALMAGSGSTVFGLFIDRGAAASAAEALRAPGWTVLVTRTLGRTAYQRRLGRF